MVSVVEGGEEWRIKFGKEIKFGFGYVELVVLEWSVEKYRLMDRLKKIMKENENEL